MDGGEIVRCPGGQRGHEGERCQEGGAASAPTRVPAGENHHHVDGPHQQGKENLGIKEVYTSDGRSGDRDHGTSDQAQAS